MSILINKSRSYFPKKGKAILQLNKLNCFFNFNFFLNFKYFVCYHRPQKKKFLQNPNFFVPTFLRSFLYFSSTFSYFLICHLIRLISPTYISFQLSYSFMFFFFFNFFIIILILFLFPTPSEICSIRQRTDDSRYLHKKKIKKKLYSKYDLMLKAKFKCNCFVFTK